MTIDYSNNKVKGAAILTGTDKVLSEMFARYTRVIVDMDITGFCEFGPKITFKVSALNEYGNLSLKAEIFYPGV